METLLQGDATLPRHRYFTLSVARAHKFLKLKAAKKT